MVQTMQILHVLTNVDKISSQHAVNISDCFPRYHVIMKHLMEGREVYNFSTTFAFFIVILGFLHVL